MVAGTLRRNLPRQGGLQRDSAVRMRHSNHPPREDGEIPGTDNNVRLILLITRIPLHFIQATRAALGDGGARDAHVRPDTSRRVILVSPGELPDAVRDAETFVVGVVGLAGDAGLQRVRVQGRRDARGGWITIADGKGKGTALRSTSSGIAVTRTAGSRNQPIESLRIETTFRTTNPRGLVSIAAVPGPR